MSITIDTILKGFPGKSNRAMLGLSSVVLLKTEHNNILIDTGGFGARNVIKSELEKHGLMLKDIDTILITHLHFDHCVNVDMFPNAELIMSKIEWDYANESDDIFVEKAVIEMIKGYKKRFVEVENETIFDGIEAVFTPGHTPGGLTYIIYDDKNVTAVAGDAIKNRAELSSGNVVMTYDEKLSRNSINKVKKIANRVLPGHDCWMRIENGSIIPEGDNKIILSFQDGLCVNESNDIELVIE